MNEICIVFAFVLALIGAFWGIGAPNTPWYGRVNALSLAFAFYMLSLLLGSHRW